MKKIEKVTKVQWWCIIGTLLVHTYNIDDYQLYDNRITTVLIRQIENLLSVRFGLEIAVPLFMFFSGFFLFYRADSCVTIGKRVKKRLQTLLVPYIFWNFVGMIFFLVVAKIPLISNVTNGNPEPINLNNILQGLFAYRYNYPFWFINRLLAYVVCAPIIYLLLKNRAFSIITVAVTAFAYESFLKSDVYTAKYFLFFVLGGAIALHKSDFIIENNKKSAPLLLGVTICLIIGQTAIEDPIIRQYTTYLMPICFWRSLDILPCSVFRVKNYQTRSFYLYCSHIIVLEAMEKIIGRVFHYSTLGALIDYVFAPMLTIFVLLVIYGVLRKLCPSFLRTICGGRVS